MYFEHPLYMSKEFQITPENDGYLVIYKNKQYSFKDGESFKKWFLVISKEWDEYRKKNKYYK